MTEQKGLEERITELSQTEREVYDILWKHHLLTYKEISNLTNIPSSSLIQYKSILKKKGYYTPKIKKQTRSIGSHQSTKYTAIAKELREGSTVSSLLSKYDITSREVYIIHIIAYKFGIPIRCIGNKEKLDEYFQTHIEPDFENKI